LRKSPSQSVLIGIRQEVATVTVGVRKLVLLLLLTAAWPAVADSQNAGSKNPYGSHSDEELTALAADWDSLDRHQRRALLTEMRLRMARPGDGDEVLHIRTERRYGRIIRQSDGRVIRIETQVVQVRPVNPGALEGRQGFGVGFEHRAARRDGVRTMTVSTSGPLLLETPMSTPLIEPPPMPMPIYQVVNPAP
jgi:hypothetical protein